MGSSVALEREQEEKREVEQSVATYKRQLASLREKVASIDVEIEQYRAITANLRRGMYLPARLSYFNPHTYNRKE
jgi:uncharacterized protein YlxW (UPF0749 family)